tara:strand:+ start:498 stop:1163 length:666 start_codon:yes stop_codon:yes gene_type:complete
MGKVIADLAASAASATLSVENATSSVGYVLSGTDGSANDHLKTDGAGNLAWVAPPAGGLTHASQWRLTTNFSNSATPITTNLEAVIAATPTTTTASPTSSTALGAPMSLDTSTGYWTFPSTGYWRVDFTCTIDGDTYDPLPVGGYIRYTTNNSTFNTVSEANAMAYLGYYQNSNASVLLDITDTTQCKVMFSFQARGSSDVCIGGATSNWTFMNFMRLADT